MSNVEHPSHYGGAENTYETIKVLEAVLTEQEALGFMIGNAIKYLSRYRGKNGLEDLRKAEWYVNRAIRFAEATGADVGGSKLPRDPSSPPMPRR